MRRDSLEDDGKGSDKAGGDKKGSIVVGRAWFTEQKVLAELYAGVLADAGYDAQVKTVQNREALAVRKAEAEAEFKAAPAADSDAARGVGQVIDLTAHDETEQIDVAGLRTALRA
ncbi:hypothetical protein SALBM135S_04501 [Streptomyces alboniger]